MSNTIINWRFFVWHLQVVQPSDWRAYRQEGRSIVTWRRNPYAVKGSPIAFYEGRRYAAALALALAGLVWWIL